VLAILYDVHANLLALEAVVADARRRGVTRWLLGGDYAGFGPWTLETLAVLDTLGAEVMLRGNGERWLKEPPPDRPETHEEIARDRDQLGPERVERLYALRTEAEIDGMLFVHGSPLSDVESFKRELDEEFDRRLLDGVAGRTVVFGHSHLQFRRPGPDDTVLVNPGSVGMPLDGDVRAAWATWDGDFAFHRVEYDVELAVAAAQALDTPMREVIAHRYLHASDPET
jgi:diadenosine tetraphosphatase ApaH/serine/threonine PP2A family protein phosphatase